MKNAIRSKITDMKHTLVVNNSLTKARSLRLYCSPPPGRPYLTKFPTPRAQKMVKCPGYALGGGGGGGRSFELIGSLLRQSITPSSWPASFLVSLTARNLKLWTCCPRGDATADDRFQTPPSREILELG